MAIPLHTHPSFLRFITSPACHQSSPQRSKPVGKGRPELSILSVPAVCFPGDVSGWRRGFITVSVNLWDRWDLARRGGQVRLVGRVVMSAGEENRGVGNGNGWNR